MKKEEGYKVRGRTWTLTAHILMQAHLSRSMFIYIWGWFLKVLQAFLHHSKATCQRFKAPVLLPTLDSLGVVRLTNGAETECYTPAIDKIRPLRLLSAIVFWAIWQFALIISWYLSHFFFIFFFPRVLFFTLLLQIPALTLKKTTANNNQAASGKESLHSTCSELKLPQHFR